MEMVTVRDFRTSPAKVRKRLKANGTLVLTNNGNPMAVLLDADAATLDDTLDAICQARAVRAMAKMQMAARRSGASEMSMDEVDAVIAATRKAGKHVRRGH